MPTDRRYVNVYLHEGLRLRLRSCAQKSNLSDGRAAAALIELALNAGLEPPAGPPPEPVSAVERLSSALGPPQPRGRPAKVSQHPLAPANLPLLFPDGKPRTEEDLRASLGMSGSYVRTMLLQLVHQGYLVEFPGVGFCLPPAAAPASDYGTGDGETYR